MGSRYNGSTGNHYLLEPAAAYSDIFPLLSKKISRWGVGGQWYVRPPLAATDPEILASLVCIVPSYPETPFLSHRESSGSGHSSSLEESGFSSKASASDFHLIGGHPA